MTKVDVTKITYETLKKKKKKKILTEFVTSTMKY